MMLGAHDALGASLERAILITKDGHLAPQAFGIPNVEIMESAHPIPDERSLDASRWREVAASPDIPIAPPLGADQNNVG